MADTKGPTLGAGETTLVEFDVKTGEAWLTEDAVVAFSDPIWTIVHPRTGGSGWGFTSVTVFAVAGACLDMPSMLIELGQMKRGARVRLADYVRPTREVNGRRLCECGSTHENPPAIYAAQGPTPGMGESDVTGRESDSGCNSLRGVTGE